MRVRTDHQETSEPLRDASGAARGPIVVRPDHGTWMLTSLLLWLCALPLVGVFVLPWLGPRATLTVVVALLGIIVGVCYGVCAWQITGPRRGAEDE